MLGGPFHSGGLTKARADTLYAPIGGGGAVSAITRTITQASHGFSAGNWLVLSGSDTYALGKSDAAADADYVGMVSSVVDANAFVLTLKGWVTGLSGLTADTQYFGDPSTAGAMTATPPTTAGQVVIPLFQAATTTSGYVDIGQGLVVKVGIVTDTDGSTITFDMSVSDRHTVTLGGSRTLAVSNDSDGQAFLLRLTQDGTGSRTVTWWGGIRWPSGAVPTLTTTAGKTDVFSFLRVGSGSYDGFVVAQNL